MRLYGDVCGLGSQWWSEGAIDTYECVYYLQRQPLFVAVLFVCATMCAVFTFKEIHNKYLDVYLRLTARAQQRMYLLYTCVTLYHTEELQRGGFVLSQNCRMAKQLWLNKSITGNDIKFEDRANKRIAFHLKTLNIHIIKHPFADGHRLTFVDARCHFPRQVHHKIATTSRIALCRMRNCSGSKLILPAAKRSPPKVLLKISHALY